MLEKIRENEQLIGMLPYRISMLRQCYIFKFSKKNDGQNYLTEKKFFS